MKNIIILALLLAVAYYLTGLEQKEKRRNETSGSTIAKVVHVIDGDTLVVKIDGKNEKIRLLGIDTPEVKGPYTKEEPYGQEASKVSKNLASNKIVGLEFGGATRRDRHGRLLAHVTLPDKRVLNEILLSEGLAEFYRKFSYTHKEKYREIEREARRNCRGLWKDKLSDC